MGGVGGVGCVVVVGVVRLYGAWVVVCACMVGIASIMRGGCGDWGWPQVVGGLVCAWLW